ncbi:MAG: hypothetical protein HYX37_03340 [Rhizobiales bacterium]|nr:hypothetical protein [Hyphomicrobiales bacterium]
MSNRTHVMIATIAIVWALLMAAAPMANAQQNITPCSAKTWPGLTFGPGTPTYAVAALNGKCYCGIWSNVTPQQAMDQGWYASCNNGKGICNFAAGTRASNQVCGPF